MRKRWQSIRRIGQHCFIILFVLGSWLLILAVFLVMTPLLFPSIVLRHLPLHFYKDLILQVLMCSVLLYFGGWFLWRHNEQKYSK